MEIYTSGETKNFTTQQFIKSRYFRSENQSPKSARNISVVKSWNRDDSSKNSLLNLKSPSPCIRKSSNSIVSCTSNSAKKVSFNLEGNEVFHVDLIKKERRKK